MKQKVQFRDLGLMEYQGAWDYQELLLKENVSKKITLNTPQAGVFKNGLTLPDNDTMTQHHLLFVEHPPVYTLGKNGKMSNVLMGKEEMMKNGIGFFNINRGGDITFHGPGQVVGYPILDLEKFGADIGKYLRNIEEVIILSLAEFGIEAGRSKGETGVWIDAGQMGKERKICAIGVRCSRWITMHGFAFNVNTDLSYFQHIIPCGISNKQVTSLEKELGARQEMEIVKQKIKKNFEKVFDAVLQQGD